MKNGSISLKTGYNVVMTHSDALPPETPQNTPHHAPRSIATFLEDVFVRTSPGEAESSMHYSIDEVLGLLHERGYGLIVILLGLPIAIPGNPPPIPSIFAFPLCILCCQMMMGYETPRLPAFLGKKTVSKQKLANIIMKASPYLRKLEFFTRPRLAMLASARNERLIGACMLLFGLCVMIPLPLTNTVPGIGMILMSVGMLNRDGLFVLGGAALGTAWIIGLILFGKIAADSVQAYF